MKFILSYVYKLFFKTKKEEIKKPEPDYAVLQKEPNILNQCNDEDLVNYDDDL